MEFIVRGATLVNPERCYVADVWIKEEMIHYIHEHIPPKPPIQEIDGSDYYMLPGFFRFGTSLGGARASGRQFKECQEQWFQSGFTAYVDDLTMVRASNWRTALAYEMAMHHNSWLAPRVRLRVPYRLVNEALIRAVLAHRVPMLDLIMQPSDSLSSSFWPLLLAGFARYRLAVKLSFARECTLQERKRWLTENLPQFVSMLQYRGISLVLDEQPEIVKFVSNYKHSYGSYITWEVGRDAPLSYERKQFGEISFLPQGLQEHGMNEQMLRRMVEVGSRLPAKLFAAYPQKGALVAGSQADFFLLSKKFFGNDATFWTPSFVYTKGRRNKYLLFTEKDVNRSNTVL